MKTLGVCDAIEIYLFIYLFLSAVTLNDSAPGSFVPAQLTAVHPSRIYDRQDDWEHTIVTILFFFLGKPLWKISTPKTLSSSFFFNSPSAVINRDECPIRAALQKHNAGRAPFKSVRRVLQPKNVKSHRQWHDDVHCLGKERKKGKKQLFTVFIIIIICINILVCAAVFILFRL